MIKPLLKVTVELIEPEHGDDGLIYQQKKIYPTDYASERYHTFMTYEVLEMLQSIHRAAKEHA